MFYNKKNSKSIFYICYFLLLMENMFSTIPILNFILKYLGYGALLCLVLYIISINRQVKKKEFLKIIVCIVLILIIAFISDNKQFLKIMLIMIAFKNIDFDDFCKKDFLYRLLLLLSVIVLSFFDIPISENAIRENGTIRYSLGFFHPNILGLHTLVLCLEYIYLHRNSNKSKQFLALIGVLLFNIFVTDSRACIISLILMFIYLCIPQKVLVKIYNNNLCKLIVKNIYLIFIIIMIILSFNFKLGGNNFINKIDDMLSARLFCANYYVTNYNFFVPFGQYIESLDDINSPNFLPLDIGYLYFLAIYGPILMALFLYMIHKLFNILYKHRNYILITIFLIWGFYSLIEANALTDLYNPFLILLSVFFYDNNQDTKKEVIEC